MIDHDAAYLALRARARTVSIATTGTLALAATATGYTRSDGGSFLTDGFRVGMEFVTTGFATNAYHVITRVTASTITTPDTITAETSASGRTLTVGLPQYRVWENSKAVASSVQAETVPDHRVYVADEYVPATHIVHTMPANGGRAEETGLYVFHWFGLSNTGTAGIRDCVSAVLALFTPGTSITSGSDVIRVRGMGRGQPGPWADQLRPLGNGRTVCTIRVPWIADTANVVA